MLCLFAFLSEAVFVYLCICVFVYLHLHVRQLESLFLMSLYHYLFKNISHVVFVCIFDRICICVFVYLCICVFVFGLQARDGMWMDHGWHKLSENIWFVWSKRSYSGDKRGCHACGRTDGRPRNVKIELEFWKQNSQKRFNSGIARISQKKKNPNSGNFTDSFRHRDHWRDFFLK